MARTDGRTYIFIKGVRTGFSSEHGPKVIAAMKAGRQFESEEELSAFIVDNKARPVWSSAFRNQIDQIEQFLKKGPMLAAA